MVWTKYKERQDKLTDLDQAIKLYTDVTKGWLVTSIKKPVLSVVSDPDINFDFRDPNIDDITREQRMMRLKVRVKGIISELAATAYSNKVPQPLLLFLKTLCKPKAIIPDNFLTEFEMNRIPADDYGTMG